MPAVCWMQSSPEPRSSHPWRASGSLFPRLPAVLKLILLPKVITNYTKSAKVKLISRLQNDFSDENNKEDVAATQKILSNGSEGGFDAIIVEAADLDSLPPEIKRQKRNPLIIPGKLSILYIFVSMFLIQFYFFSRKSKTAKDFGVMRKAEHWIWSAQNQSAGQSGRWSGCSCWSLPVAGKWRFCCHSIL